MKIERRFTQPGTDPLDTVEWDRRESVIREPDGTVVFEMRDIEVPKSWSQVATDILAQKYFRKAGVPQPDGTLGRETSARQVMRRLAGCWTDWGRRYNYFDTDEDAAAFDAELTHMLINQMAAPNSPQWFNTGLAYAYGIKGTPQGHYYVDPVTNEVRESEDTYSRIQGHACFIQSVEDDLVNPNGIMDLWVREARIFKLGSGSGSNYSNLRAEGERLAGGGTSSGLMSFLRVGDRAAGAIKSGGTTRRAAKMVVLDMDHPDIDKFINWKVDEEKKAAALIAAGFDGSYEGEAYSTVSGQNSNNSVRVPDRFVDAVLSDGTWDLTWRTNGEVARTVRARDLWNQIACAAWSCADPGVQYDDIINSWHTCPAGGRIRASNPCSEYLHLDDTGCNLASLNLMKFYDTERNLFDTESFKHAVRLWTIVLEITVVMAHFPSAKIARNSYDYRELGLGYANLGTLLMVSGIPYDSPRALAICGAITAMLTGEAYAASAEMAGRLGPFPRYSENAEAMLRVIRNHRRVTYNAPAQEYEGLRILPVGIDQTLCPPYLLAAARDCWDRALAVGEQHGYRNSQATVLAPTGTIGLLMSCDTTGVEPDFAIVKFKKLAGGGYFKIVNESLVLALRNLRYKQSQIDDIIRYVKGSGTLNGAPYINTETLRARRFTDEDLAKVEKALPSAFEISFAFTSWALGEEAMNRLGFTTEQYLVPGFDLLRELGYTREEIDAANNAICGAMTVEGAPHLKEEHYPIFDCANKCGKIGKRFIHHMGHVRMMAAAQPLISGGISKTINMPNEVSVADVQEVYMRSWELGVKCIALYRDGSKLSQPLSNKGTDKTGQDDDRQLALSEDFERRIEEARHQRAEELRPDEILAAAQRILANTTNTEFRRKIAKVVERNRLPAKRRGWTQKAKIAGHTVFLRTGEYGDGTLGEIFIDLHKEGASFRSLMNCFTGDTRFFDGNSLVTLGSMAGKPVTVTCVDGLRRLARVVEFGEQPVQRVVLKVIGSNGSSFRRTVTVTPNHRWVLEDGSVTTSLRVGDRLGTAAINPVSEIDPDGFMHGFVFGDGDRHVYYPERYHLRLCGAKDQAHLPALAGLAHTISHPPSLHGDPRLTFISPDLELKSLPDTARHSHGYIAGFIRGWMSADGGSNCRGAELLCSSNQDAAKWFIANAALYGYTITGVSIDDKPTNFGPRKSPLWRITARQVMMPHLVESIESLDRRESVYCVVEPTTNTFLLEGGILTGNCFAIAISIGLQYGVPLEEFVDKFVFTRFEPNGFVDHPNIKHCTSVVDYIFRVLGMEYLGRTDFVQVKPEDRDVDSTNHEELAEAEFEARVAAQQVADEPRHAPSSGDEVRGEAKARNGHSKPSADPGYQATAQATADPNLAEVMTAMRSREAQMAAMMGDAPLCDVCGSITRRNGACYVCDSCGRSMGCS
jgi:ribonucleoside-diphosphate reductase alpha chain